MWRISPTESRMPAILRLDELPIKWIAKAQYRAAQVIAFNADERIYTDEDTSSAYVLTSEGLQTYKKITPGLVKKWVSYIMIYHVISSAYWQYHICIMWYHRYKSCINGIAPKGAEKDFEKLAGICEAMNKGRPPNAIEYKKDGKFGKNSFMPETKLIQN